MPSDVQALSVNMASRHLAADEARERTRETVRWLLSMGCRSFYKKIDSTLRGNVGAEIAILAHDPKWDLVAIAPAFPGAGRITLGGYQLVAGNPVNLSAYAQDPLAPALESHVPSLLKGRVGLIEWQQVRQGAGIIAEHFTRLRSQGVRQVVLDAVTPDDLRAIALAIHMAPFMVLPVGSAGLAGALSAVRQGPPLLTAPSLPPVGSRTPPVLLISGSANPVSLNQLQELELTTRLVLADIRQLLLTGEEEIDRLSRQVLQSLVAGRDVILTTAISSERLQSDQALGAELGLSAFQLGHHLSALMGRLARRIVEQGEVENLVLVGGETAEAVLAELPGDRLEILSALLPAIPVAHLVGTRLRVVTKSGGFGEPDALTRIVALLRTTGLAENFFEPPHAHS